MKYLFAVMVALVACNGHDKATVDYLRSPRADSAHAKHKKKHFKDTVVVHDSAAVDSVSIDTSEASAGGIFRLAAFSAQVVVDSSTYKIKYTLGTYNTGDTVQVRLTRDSSATVKPVTINRNRFARIDSVSFRVDKIYNTTAKYASCVRRRKNALLAEICQSWQTNYTKVPDSMSVDSSLAIKKIDIKPDTAKVFSTRKTDGTVNSVGITQQFCALVVFRDGKVALRAIEKDKPDCVNQYGKFPLAARSVSAKQQAVADKVCINWTATGGTIGAEICPTTGTPL